MVREVFFAEREEFARPQGLPRFPTVNPVDQLEPHITPFMPVANRGHVSSKEKKVYSGHEKRTTPIRSACPNAKYWNYRQLRC